MSWPQRVGAVRAVILAFGFSLIVSVLVEAVDLDPSLGTRRFHVALETADAMVLIFLAAVLLGRFRSDGSRRNLLLAAAVVVLAGKNGLYAALAMFAEDLPTGDDPSVWGTALSGVIGAALLAAAGLLPDRRIDNSIGRTMALLALGGAAVVSMTVLASLLHESLPFAFPPVPADTDSVTELNVFSGHPAKIAIDLATAACYAIAAVSFARLADRSGDAFISWLGIGSAIAAGAFVNYALIPSRFTELIYGGEILWILAVMAFWYGAISEISNLEAALVRSAVRSERKRVARDLHDGVVQELAYISTQAAWLLGRADGQPYEQPVRRIRDAVERALDESRGAIAALNREMDEPLHHAVGNAAADVATRVGVRLDLDLDPTSKASAEWRDALIRIAREAVGNAVRHGGAKEVRLGLTGDPAVLTVCDDGKGFDPTSPRSPQSFGLQSMRERAESLGGDFELESTPGHGTTVRVTLTRSG
jgi:signal transduction histidine kinase